MWDGTSPEDLLAIAQYLTERAVLLENQSHQRSANTFSGSESQKLALKNHEAPRVSTALVGGR
jgi:hypothetical protein